MNPFTEGKDLLNKVNKTGKHFSHGEKIIENYAIAKVAHLMEYQV